MTDHDLILRLIFGGSNTAEIMASITIGLLIAFIIVWILE